MNDEREEEIEYPRRDAELRMVDADLWIQDFASKKEPQNHYRILGLGLLYPGSFRAWLPSRFRESLEEGTLSKLNARRPRVLPLLNKLDTSITNQGGVIKERSSL